MARPRSTDPSSSWSFWLPDSLMETVSMAASDQGVTRNAFVRTAIYQWILETSPELLD